MLNPFLSKKLDGTLSVPRLCTGGHEVFHPNLHPTSSEKESHSHLLQGGAISTGTGNTRFSTTAPHPTGVHPKPGQGDTSVFCPPGRARRTCPGGQRRPLRRSTSLIFNALAVPAGRTGAFRRFTPLTRGPPNIANNATPPVAALWADRNRSGGGSQCGIRSLLPIFRDKAHRKGADGGTLCLDHTTDRAPAHKGRGAGWQCALRREGVELRNHHSEPYLLCTTAPWILV